MDEGRRYKLLPISQQLFRDLLVVSDRSVHVRCVEGLPSDARLINHGYDVQRDMHYLVFESAEWEPVMPFEQLPILNISLQRYHTDDLLAQAFFLIGGRLEADGEVRQWLDDYRRIQDVS